jgi:hypothetical protein
MPSWDSPLQSLLPIRSGVRFDRAAGPHARGRDDVSARLGLKASRSGWIGLVRLRTAGSPGVSHLPTVTALRSSGRGAGSWLHLARDAGCVRHRTLLAPSTPTQPGVRTPDPAPPSIGVRLATSSVRQCLFFRERGPAKGRVASVQFRVHRAGPGAQPIGRGPARRDLRSRPHRVGRNPHRRAVPPRPRTATRSSLSGSPASSPGGLGFWLGVSCPSTSSRHGGGSTVFQSSLRAPCPRVECEGRLPNQRTV